MLKPNCCFGVVTVVCANRGRNTRSTRGTRRNRFVLFRQDFFNTDLREHGARRIPLLSKEGSLRRRRRRGWSVQSPAKRLLIDAREAHLINRYCSSLNRPPQPSLR